MFLSKTMTFLRCVSNSKVFKSSVHPWLHSARETLLVCPWSLWYWDYTAKINIDILNITNYLVQVNLCTSQTKLNHKWYVSCKYPLSTIESVLPTNARLPLHSLLLLVNSQRHWWPKEANSGLFGPLCCTVPQSETHVLLPSYIKLVPPTIPDLHNWFIWLNWEKIQGFALLAK